MSDIEMDLPGDVEQELSQLISEPFEDIPLPEKSKESSNMIVDEHMGGNILEEQFDENSASDKAKESPSEIDLYEDIECENVVEKPICVTPSAEKGKESSEMNVDENKESSSEEDSATSDDEISKTSSHLSREDLYAGGNPITKIIDLDVPEDKTKTTEKTEKMKPLMSWEIPRYQFYVCNLNWWTKEEDLRQALTNIRVSDVKEIKLHEDRANGRSKGFCTLRLGSKASSDIVIDQLQRVTIHELKPMVISFTDESLVELEANCKTRPVPIPPAKRKADIQGGPTKSLVCNIPRRLIGPLMPVPGAFGPRLPHFMVPPPPMGGAPNYPPPGYGQPPPPTSFVPTTLDAPVPVNDPEFEEILERNKSVCSSAIARAVADAGSGEYIGAMETVVTAISLIKQSKVSRDDRCKLLIGSLQDALVEMVRGYLF